MKRIAQDLALGALFHLGLLGIYELADDLIHRRDPHLFERPSLFAEQLVQLAAVCLLARAVWIADHQNPMPYLAAAIGLWAAILAWAWWWGFLGEFPARTRFGAAARKWQDRHFPM